MTIVIHDDEPKIKHYHVEQTFLNLSSLIISHVFSSTFFIFFINVGL
jgi:hypothetical protein